MSSNGSSSHTVFITDLQARDVAAELIRVGVAFAYALQMEGFRIHRHTITVDDSRTVLLDRIVAIIKLRHARK